MLVSMIGDVKVRGLSYTGWAFISFLIFFKVIVSIILMVVAHNLEVFYSPNLFTGF